METETKTYTFKVGADDISSKAVPGHLDLEQMRKLGLTFEVKVQIPVKLEVRKLSVRVADENFNILPQYAPFYFEGTVQQRLKAPTYASVDVRPLHAVSHEWKALEKGRKCVVVCDEHGAQLLGSTPQSYGGLFGKKEIDFTFAPKKEGTNEYP